MWIKRTERQPHQGHDNYRNKRSLSSSITPIRNGFNARNGNKCWTNCRGNKTATIGTQRCKFGKSEQHQPPFDEERSEETLSHKGKNFHLQKRKNNSMQILFRLALSRQFSCMQPNQQHLQKTLPLCKIVTLKQTRSGNHVGWLWPTSIRGGTNSCQQHHNQNNSQTKNFEVYSKLDDWQ